MMVTNAVLGGVADTVAQSITAIRQRALRKSGGTPLSPKQDPIAVEIHELDRKNPLNDRELVPDSKALPPPFDFERLTRFMAYGFCMAPLQFKWFQFLSRTFPITSKTSAFAQAMKRVVFDQLIFAPFGLGVFFTAMTVAEGGGRREVLQKLRDMYVPTLKANYMLWPAVQVINFRLMPVQFQLVSFPAVASVFYSLVANMAFCNSPLCRRSVLLGPPTFLLQTLQRMPSRANLLRTLQKSDWSEAYGRC
jgi:protein Mpv17